MAEQTVREQMAEALEAYQRDNGWHQREMEDTSETHAILYRRGFAALERHRAESEYAE